MGKERKTMSDLEKLILRKLPLPPPTAEQVILLSYNLHPTIEQVVLLSYSPHPTAEQVL